AAVEAADVALGAPVLEDRAVAGLDLVLVEVEAEDLAGRLVLPVQRAGAALGVREPVGALAGSEVEVGGAAAAALRDDLDHAVRRFGAVQRGCRRTLDHL